MDAAGASVPAAAPPPPPPALAALASWRRCRASAAAEGGAPSAIYHPEGPRIAAGCRFMSSLAAPSFCLRPPHRREKEVLDLSLSGSSR